MIRRPPRSTRKESSAASDVYKRQIQNDLKNSGVKVGPLHEHRDGTASFYMKDTEGNWLEMLYIPPEGIQSNV